ncbi:TlpA disulfide reductase family protein [Aureibaculum sp. 2210JD6-5]|uniref:TlpA family protein disulfide reductase n=1 Tax=Aureibaculum sp. 2210JD6-5 TaxID=3103957 RepID=UPI002AAE8484|nr:TlpA disulfide reductase family protein [Aureibaculum sp. 2210JD6-5]MDY7396763.1 TlpA disulfide reductase family protein [Aureibaculum sp. 2210JD6-5]
MRKIVFIIIAILAIQSCKKNEIKDYVTISGKITDKNSDSLVVLARNYSKKIKVNTDGTFHDTLKVKDDNNFVIYDGKEQSSIFLKNGYDLNITLDTKQFDETIKYNGVGSQPNNYLAEKTIQQEQFLAKNNDIYSLDKNTFDTKINTFLSDLETKLKSAKNLDSLFIAQQTNVLNSTKKRFYNTYNEKQYLLNELGNGKTSPEFVNFENNAGGFTSLSDLKGKYVYIDVWATWCAPCKKEIPFLKELEKSYHDKNIEFVSISVDQEKDHDKWKQMIVDQELGGIQLFANKSWNSSFIKDYRINGIPRFILIDSEGNIVSSEAPRPSLKKDIQELFRGLNI